MGCKKCAEGVCGCSTMNAEEPAVEEPDWIPAGDGRAIGQQNFGINLSPLHAEGKSKCGCGCSIGKCQCPKGCKCGCGDHKADTVGSPSPTFNEDITGQDGPSANPTNAVFEARERYGPRKEDMKAAKDRLKRRGYKIEMDRYLYSDTPSKTTGVKADKYYYIALTEKDGNYRVHGFYGPVKKGQTEFNVMGGLEDPHRNTISLAKALGTLGAGPNERSLRGWIAKREKRGYRTYMLDPNDNFVQVKAAESFRAEPETLAEIEGPTAEATTGGLHAPSSFAMTWEDGMGQSSASIPPNEIAWAEGKSTSWMTWACGIALVLAGGALLKAKSGERKAADNFKTAVKSRKGCCGGSKKSEMIRKDSEYSVGQINPVVVEDQNDIYGAEQLHSPQTAAKVSQPNWGPQKTYCQNQRNNLKMW